MQAHDRRLPEWFDRIRTRQITLPRFQRFIAWGHSEISGLLTTVLRGLPSGAALILEVGDKEKFISRTITDAPSLNGKVTEQLLDGQQRITALWRSLNNKYTDRTYLVGFEEDPEMADYKLPVVHSQARWVKNGKNYPLWVDQPKYCWERGLIPLYLLNPDINKDEIDLWIEQAIPEEESDKFTFFKNLNNKINELRTKVREFNLPYLSLPIDTTRDIALEVFIKMNTSSVKLSTYDIIVALVESETGKSLHDHVSELIERVPRIADYVNDVPGIVLDTVALRQNRVPGQSGYQGINFEKMIHDFPIIINSIKGLVEFLEEECIFDAARLPSYTALPVIAALWELLPSQPDNLGNARLLLRKYLWRAFLTTRYEQSSSSNALQDFRALKKSIENFNEENIPIFNNEIYPIPNAEIIKQVDWPSRKSILARGLLALQLKAGAEDIADGRKASLATITSKNSPREYHHLFPKSKLIDAKLPNDEIYRAVNCALITWKTNRTISNKDPINYLRERIDNSTLGESELKHRLKTHLIPFEELNVGDYKGLNEEQKNQKIREDYMIFCHKRAQLLTKAAEIACEGRQINISEIFL